MRICYISAGAFSHIGAYLDYFKNSGHDVHFVALSPSPPRPVPVHDVALGGTYSPTRGKWKYPLSMLRARAVVRELNPDVVHAHYATSGGLASLVCGRHPTVVTAHGTDLTAGSASRVWRPLLGAVFAHADCVNTVSADLRAKALSLGVAPEKVAVLTPGVDTARFFRREPPRVGDDGVLKLICTRRLEATYDPLTIIEALALLAKSGARFRVTFAGDGALRARAQERTRELRLADHVTFLGAVAEECMPAVLRDHHIYLSASRWDGTSLSLLEALSMGLFPVVSRIPANSAWLEHGQGALLHAPGDPADLAERLREVARDPELIPRWAPANRAKVVERGDRAANMRALERIYESLAGRKKETQP